MDSLHEPPRSNPTLRESMRDALLWWEPMRLHYNIVLAIVVAYVFWSHAPESLERITTLRCVRAIILAGLANLAYCAAYAADVALLFCGFVDARPLWRRALFAAGTLFAAAITFVVSSFAAVPF